MAALSFKNLAINSGRCRSATWINSGVEAVRKVHLVGVKSAEDVGAAAVGVT